MKRACDFFNGTGNLSKKFVSEREELVIVNDGTSDLTFNAGPYTTWTLKPGEVFDERIAEFTYLNITGSGAYRGYVRDDV
ncbi:hypothetical protein [Peribacillus huizhouensis]|uniref:Uncharacterized protein n=1 Tax=Peribacillus huizhouensis TaxID=1501239 RepID=A0ABR6CR66_9BACI|nr:hypothetical protein [Peribacillus huizhouensis]MBA9027528.1 hypothetical protein [Peribacillus huizhouensis]